MHCYNFKGRKFEKRNEISFKRTIGCRLRKLLLDPGVRREDGAIFTRHLENIRDPKVKRRVVATSE
jgi:hypothetical protein